MEDLKHWKNRYDVFDVPAPQQVSEKGSETKTLQSQVCWEILQKKEILILIENKIFIKSINLKSGDIVE